MIEILKHLFDRRYLASTEGNVSIKISPDRVLTTPTGTNKGFLKSEDLVLTDLSGRTIGLGKPSSEIQMHLEVYHQKPEIKAVIHAHPRNATAFALSLIHI